ncbi:MAG: glycosyltransferase [Flavobacteriaceae bacterium]|jgi:glycosyltransferase involved in cell wall biosynthesis|nr:glycosyltransferase [Flavobacteriaceae bacterium]
MTHPLISIIVPCYNQAGFLDSCIESLIKQTYSHWECIIINDGSTDNTNELSQRWTEKDIRVKYIKQKNKGLSSARNSGMKIAKGDYIQLLDSDDFIHPNKFKTIVEIIEKQSPDIIFSDFMYVDSEGKTKNEYEKYNIKKDINTFDTKFLLDEFNDETNMVLPPMSYIIKSSLIGATLFNETLKAYEDRMFLIDITYGKKISFHQTHEVYNYYRIHGNNMTMAFQTMRNTIFDFYRVLISKYPELSDEIVNKLLAKELQHRDNIYLISRGKMDYSYYIKLLLKKVKNSLVKR